MQETGEMRVRSLNLEEPLEERMTTHSAGVQPQQDPGGTLRMNGVSERET